jgi:hypothetical protein
MKADMDKMSSRYEKNLATEREKVTFLETRIEESLVSNADLRSRLEIQESESQTARVQNSQDQLYIDGLRDKCSELQERKYILALIQQSDI